MVKERSGKSLTELIWSTEPFFFLFRLIYTRFIKFIYGFRINLCTRSFKINAINTLFIQ